MKKRFISRTITISLALVLIISATVMTATAAVRASKYLESYVVTMEAHGNGKLVIAYGVYGTGVMDQLGAQKLVVEVETSPDRWIPVFTIDGDNDPDRYYAYNSRFCEGTYTFTGNIYDRYRVVLTAYAAKGTGSDTGEIDSTPVNCK